MSSGPDDGALGYDILTPFEMAGGGIVLVNRGFVPLDKKDPATRRQPRDPRRDEYTGLMRFPQTHAWFSPPDDPGKNVWFSRDPASIAKAHGLRRVAPVIVDADQVPSPAPCREAGRRASLCPTIISNTR